MPTKRNNNVAVSKVRVLVELTDTIRHLKTFRVIFNASSQADRMPTKRNNKDAVSKVRVLVERTDTIRHLKTFRVISKEMPVLLLILCWCCFSCLEMYSEKFFNANFNEKIFLKSLWQKEAHVSFLGK